MKAKRGYSFKDPFKNITYLQPHSPRKFTQPLKREPNVELENRNEPTSQTAQAFLLEVMRIGGIKKYEVFVKILDRYRKKEITEEETAKIVGNFFIEYPSLIKEFNQFLSKSSTSVSAYQLINSDRYNVEKHGNEKHNFLPVLTIDSIEDMPTEFQDQYFRALDFFEKLKRSAEDNFEYDGLYKSLLKLAYNYRDGGVDTVAFDHTIFRLFERYPVLLKDLVSFFPKEMRVDSHCMSRLIPLSQVPPLPPSLNMAKYIDSTIIKWQSLSEKQQQSMIDDAEFLDEPSSPIISASRKQRKKRSTTPKPREYSGEKKVREKRRDVPKGLLPSVDFYELIDSRNPELVTTTMSLFLFDIKKHMETSKMAISWEDCLSILYLFAVGLIDHVALVFLLMETLSSDLIVNLRNLYTPSMLVDLESFRTKLVNSPSKEYFSTYETILYEKLPIFLDATDNYTTTRRNARSATNNEEEPQTQAPGRYIEQFLTKTEECTYSYKRIVSEYQQPCCSGKLYLKDDIRDSLNNYYVSVSDPNESEEGIKEFNEIDHVLGKPMIGPYETAIITFDDHFFMCFITVDRTKMLLRKLKIERDYVRKGFKTLQYCRQSDLAMLKWMFGDAGEGIVRMFTKYPFLYIDMLIDTVTTQFELIFDKTYSLLSGNVSEKMWSRVEPDLKDIQKERMVSAKAHFSAKEVYNRIIQDENEDRLKTQFIFDDPIYLFTTLFVLLGSFWHDHPDDIVKDYFQVIILQIFNINISTFDLLFEILGKNQEISLNELENCFLQLYIQYDEMAADDIFNVNGEALILNNFDWNDIDNSNNITFIDKDTTESSNSQLQFIGNIQLVVFYKQFQVLYGMIVEFRRKHRTVITETRLLPPVSFGWDDLELNGWINFACRLLLATIDKMPLFPYLKQKSLLNCFDFMIFPQLIKQSINDLLSQLQCDNCKQFLSLYCYYHDLLIDSGVLKNKYGGDDVNFEANLQQRMRRYLFISSQYENHARVISSSKETLYIVEKIKPEDINPYSLIEHAYGVGINKNKRKGGVYLSELSQKSNYEKKKWEWKKNTPIIPSICMFEVYYPYLLSFSDHRYHLANNQQFSKQYDDILKIISTESNRLDDKSQPIFLKRSLYPYNPDLTLIQNNIRWVLQKDGGMIVKIAENNENGDYLFVKDRKINVFESPLKLRFLPPRDSNNEIMTIIKDVSTVVDFGGLT
eukprot:TRINITY_DN1349_c0_g1_i1.p1 TRINITY_DN1349_c0_g1~~TRINITY_DN1349_c0_g1_i1.p1  ORF type:complete len:1203 (-),score=331.11 TRINITY_DN1349_c0_g1_i1:116-3724(-)